MENENITIYIRYALCFNSIAREHAMTTGRKKNKQAFSWSIQLNWKIWYHQDAKTSSGS